MKSLKNFLDDLEEVNSKNLLSTKSDEKFEELFR